MAELSVLHKKHKAWISYAKSYHKKHFEEEAKRFNEYFKNKFPKITKNDPHQVYFNYYNMNVKRLMPQLLPLNVRFNLKPKGGDVIELPLKEGQNEPETFDNAKAVMIEEEELNDYWKTVGVKYEIKMSEIDNLITNIGIISTTWYTKMEEMQVIEQTMKDLLEEKEKRGDAIEGETIQPTKLPLLREDRLDIGRKSPLKTFIDPTFKKADFSDVKYVVVDVELTRDDAEKSPYWEKLQNHKPSMTFEDIDKEHKDDTSMQIYVVSEIYDKAEKKMFVYFSKETKPIWSKDLHVFPFSFLRFNLEPDEPYPSSDFLFYETQAEEKALYRTAIMNQLNRRLPRKIFYDKDVIGEEEMKKLKSEVDMEYIGISTNNRPMRDIVMDITNNPIDFDVWRTSQEIDGEVQQLSQVNAMRLGQSGSQKATTSAIVNQQFQDAQVEKVDAIKDFCKDIARKILDLMKKHADESRDLEIEQDGQKGWIKWSKKDIEYAKEVIEVEFKPPTPTEVESQLEQNFMNLMLSPVVEQALRSEGKKIHKTYLIDSYVDILKSNKDKEKLIVDVSPMPDDPMTENEAMLNGQMAQVMEGQDHELHFQMHMRFMQSPFFQQVVPPEIKDLFIQHLQFTREAILATMPVKENRGSNPAARPDMMKQPTSAQMPGQIRGMVEGGENAPNA